MLQCVLARREDEYRWTFHLLLSKRTINSSSMDKTPRIITILDISEVKKPSIIRSLALHMGHLTDDSFEGFKTLSKDLVLIRIKSAIQNIENTSSSFLSQHAQSCHLHSQDRQATKTLQRHHSSDSDDEA
jgi:hypothetical protein